MKKLKNYGSSKKNYKRYKVYGRTVWGPEYIGETYAKSREQAVNNVRFRSYGLKLTNDPFFAEEVLGEAEVASFPWFSVEYSVGTGLDPYFYQPWASYEVIHARTKEDAKRILSDKIDYESVSESTTRITFFGRIEEFNTEQEAVKCAYGWKLKNEEEFNNEKAQ